MTKEPVKSNRIIGGLFGLESVPNPKISTPPFLSGSDIFVVNGRSGIWLLVNQIRPPQVWVPSYLCHTMLEGIDPKVAAFRFYEVDYNLAVRSNEWISEVTSGDLVIFIDYFGFPHDQQVVGHVKERGAWVLEDACQALLSSHVGGTSDFVLFSLRKWIGVPDGGILRVPEGFAVPDISLEMPENSWWLKTLEAAILRRKFDDGVPTREWFKLFREAEDTAPTGPYAMSQLSQVVFRNSVDYAVIAQRRIENYQSLSAALAPYAMFPRLEPGVVPLGFPVRVTQRDTVRQALFAHQIYPPVHWVIDGVVPPAYADSHRLASHIMTLPCDQRYEPEDMDRMATIFLQHKAPDE